MSSRRRMRRYPGMPWRLLKRAMKGLFRLWSRLQGRRRTAQSGFVFPTTILLVLMVTLTATALTYRTFSRSEQAIAQREQQVIYNAATPAVDRAKAKIEFMFREDSRFPSGVPASDILADLMLPKRGDNTFVGYTGRVPPLGGVNDPYTLPDETRLDIAGDPTTGGPDGKLDNAWSFPSDINGDGTVEDDEVVIYSILVDDIGPEGTAPNDSAAVAIEDASAKNKAGALVTRTGPLATTEATPACKGALSEGGWQVVAAANNSTLQKNFQINAVVANRNPVNQTFETLEFQQSRIAARANKWGAWFRYDLEVFPGTDFKWNGAMHTDGSVFFHDDNFNSYMVSSHNSCLYDKESSEISMGEFDNDDDGDVDITSGDFQGQAVKAIIRDNNYTDKENPRVHAWDTSDNDPPRTNLDLTSDNDSVNLNQGDSVPSHVAMNPILLYTEDEEAHINPTTWSRDADWETGDFYTRERIVNDDVAKPFVDDFYRADNRWGPKPRYSSTDPTLDVTDASNTDVQVGDDITGTVALTLTDRVTGLDGYWERQAINAGLRLIMGQRLELGNVNGWNYDPLNDTIAPNSDPLYPANDTKSHFAASNNRIGGDHEQLQRRALRDNLAAVQGMVVYHYEGPGMASGSGGEFPAFCLATTAHPGTQDTVINSRTFENYSRTFENYPDSGGLKADFLRGQGTNGWEFEFPDAFNTEAEFATAIASTEPLGRALRNLAYFAGDPAGGAPSFEPVQDASTDANPVVHPYSYLSMWGDFSVLRRIFKEYLDKDVSYDNLSFADKATLHSAACTLSLLAYNLSADLADAKALLANPPASMKDVSEQLGGAIGDIVECLNDNDPNNGGGGGVCTGTNSFDIVSFLQARGDLSNANKTTWTDPDTSTENDLCAAGVDGNGFQAKCDSAEYFSDWTLDDWVQLIEEPGVISSLDTADDDGDGVGNDVEDILEFANQVNYYTSIVRDRDLGFREGFSRNAVIAYDPSDSSFVAWDGDTGETGPVKGFLGGSSELIFSTGCDPNIFQALAAGGGGGQDNNVTAGLIACSSTDAYPIRYPSLYYLFPLVDHDHDGADYHQQPDGVNYTGQTAEDYITDTYVVDSNPLEPSDNAVLYRVVGSDPITGVSEIAAVPKAADLSDWVSDASTSAAPLTDPNAQPFRITLPGGTSGADVVFLDKGLYDGREQLNVRVLDVDLDALTTKTAVSDSDFWLSANLDEQAEGVVYFFREDAVREDEIVRPRDATATAATCSALTSGRFGVETGATCRMIVQPGTQLQDPPLTAEDISLKPVDFIPDPERRPYGIRLRTLSGAPADFSGAGFARQVGMTLVTDNAVYIQGDFNLHSTNGKREEPVEEFNETLLDKPRFGPDDFYGERTTLNTDTFANLGKDHWRPVEILSDSLTILSGTFNDGYVSDTFTKPIPGGQGGGADSSYMNQHRPEFRTSPDWMRETPGDTTSPVWVDRNGVFYLSDGTPFYTKFDSDSEWVEADETIEGYRNQQDAEETYVNAVFVSGIVPKRPNQSYGGLHNYPRMLEYWEDEDLFIYGSFLQLNFATAATGPYEQDAWESGSDPDRSEPIFYYRAPNRRWGYDVALLYVPPAPAARRFVSVGAPRSEYYRELPADDPYILNLRCAKDDSGELAYSALCPSQCNAHSCPR